MTRFTLPSDLSPEAAAGLKTAIISGGPDRFPLPCRIHIAPPELVVWREEDDSGKLTVPWPLKGVGKLCHQSATLPQSGQPYQLLLELARGKLNRLRHRMAEWQLDGFRPSPALQQQIHDANLVFTRALARHPSEEADQLAKNVLMLCCEAGSNLVQEFSAAVVQTLQRENERLHAWMSCRLDAPPQSENEAKAYLSTFNAATVPFPVHRIVTSECDYAWQTFDETVDWAMANDMEVIGGPLLDFSRQQIPKWLWLWERDRMRIAKFLCEYAADVLERYRDRITIWQLFSAANIPGLLGLTDQELLWLTLQVAEVAHKYAPDAKFIINIANPWGEYNTWPSSRMTPLDFADILMRSGLPFCAIDLEVVMGVSPRGSYCRDVIDVLALLDWFSELDMPLCVSLAYPASDTVDEWADPDLGTDAGAWSEGLTPHGQAAWANDVALAALCSDNVAGLQWIQWNDALPHQFPHCGLIDVNGNIRPALLRLRKLREKFL